MKLQKATAIATGKLSVPKQTEGVKHHVQEESDHRVLHEDGLMYDFASSEPPTGKVWKVKSAIRKENTTSSSLTEKIIKKSGVSSNAGRPVHTILEFPGGSPAGDSLSVLEGSLEVAGEDEIDSSGCEEASCDKEPTTGEPIEVEEHFQLQKAPRDEIVSLSGSEGPLEKNFKRFKNWKARKLILDKEKEDLKAMRSARAKEAMQGSCSPSDRPVEDREAEGSNDESVTLGDDTTVEESSGDDELQRTFADDDPSECSVIVRFPIRNANGDYVARDSEDSSHEGSSSIKAPMKDKVIDQPKRSTRKKDSESSFYF